MAEASDYTVSVVIGDRANPSLKKKTEMIIISKEFANGYPSILCCCCESSLDPFKRHPNKYHYSYLFVYAPIDIFTVEIAFGLFRNKHKK